MAKSIMAVLVPALVLVTAVASAQPVHLTFDIPAGAVLPGDPVWVDLDITNSGPVLDDAQLFVAMGIGTGDYWFWPGWVHYPPDLDWLTTDIEVGSAEQEVLPGFAWPPGAGSGSALFISAVLAQGVLASNVAVAALSWLEPPPEVLALGSTFTMGSPPAEMCRFDDEAQHSVTLTRTIYVQQSEVTQARWEALMGMNPSTFSGDPQRPVETVTWYDCAVYCNRLSVLQGLRPAYYSDASFTTLFDGTPPITSGSVFWDQTAPGFRLPTEAEWEHASRAATTSAYCSGQDSTSCEQDPNLDQLAWYSFNSSGTTHPVGQKAANAWSLRDMHGNVSEWCWDWYDTYPAGPATNPTGPTTGSERVVRGGGWHSYASGCRSACRTRADPDSYSFKAGLRPVRNAP